MAAPHVVVDAPPGTRMPKASSVMAMANTTSEKKMTRSTFAVVLEGGHQPEPTRAGAQARASDWTQKRSW